MILVNMYKIKWNKRLTHEEIAKGCGMSHVTVGKLLKGEPVDFKLSTLEKICKYFGCSIHDILVEVQD